MKNSRYLVVNTKPPQQFLTEKKIGFTVAVIKNLKKKTEQWWSTIASEFTNRKTNHLKRVLR